MGYFAWTRHRSGNCFFDKGEVFPFCGNVCEYIWLFMHETYFWRIIGPNYRKCTLMYPYFMVLFVARKLFKKWCQPWFPFARAQWFFKMHLRFLWYLSTVMWQHLIFHIFACETSLFCYHGVFFGLVLCFCSKSSYWLVCCYC